MKKKHLYNIVFVILIIIGLIIGCLIFYFNNNVDQYEEFTFKNEFEIKDDNIDFTNQIEQIEIKNKIVIHVTGQVVNEGIVKIDEDSRVIDAIEEAGGITNDADLSLINLAYKLEDGSKIYIPSKKDTEEIIEAKTNDNYMIYNNSSTYQNKNTKNTKININTATITDFEKLPGIGQSIAERIIKYRNENGKFKTIEDLKNISGIGDSKLNNIKQYIYIK